MESVPGCSWNECPDQRGISVRMLVEWVSGWSWNPQHDHLICIVSDFSGAGERTLQLMRQLAAHNDVIALQVYDPIALNLPSNGRILVTQGELQVDLAVGRRQVNEPLGNYLSGRLKDVATLLKRSQVPLMMFSTAEEAHVQLRAELGKQGGGRR